MKIGALTPLSLGDYPGRAAAVVLTQGCNFRCPYCHSGDLLLPDTVYGSRILEGEVLEFLEERRGDLGGVVLGGGEPTIQPDLVRFLRRVKHMGFDVKLDTNGSRSGVLHRLIRDGLVDFVAMDVKAPATLYDHLTGVRAPFAEIAESIGLIARSGVEHEFRTTVVDELLSARDIERVRDMIPSGSIHRLQEFRREKALDSKLRGEGESARRTLRHDTKLLGPLVMPF
ncbi:MAG: anaerobic ribonucleoside-triphosphate reductase activating protein [Planctomycetota bacterium]|jgi:pyruvate formate lyase activating enzyme